MTREENSAGPGSASSRCSCAFRMAAPSPSPRAGLQTLPTAAAAAGGQPGGWEAHTAGRQLGPGHGAGSRLGSFVGHGGELVTDAAQAV